MVKKVQTPIQETKNDKKHPKSKLHRLGNLETQQPIQNNRKTWPTNGVVYIGHLPHGFYEQQLTQYFSQYGDVLAVKVGRSRKTNRSRGYAFIQFKYPQVAQIVSETMNNYLLMGKVITSQNLQATAKNPFHFSSSKKYKFINWKKLYIKNKNQVKDQQTVYKQIKNLVQKEEQRRKKFQDLNIQYQYPGYSALLQK